jgi:hypothetical protein
MRYAIVAVSLFGLSLAGGCGGRVATLPTTDAAAEEKDEQAAREEAAREAKEQRAGNQADRDE